MIMNTFDFIFITIPNIKSNKNLNIDQLQHKLREIREIFKMHIYVKIHAKEEV